MQNVWLGVTVECKATGNRIEPLRKLNASIKFLSCEPLIEDLEGLDLQGIDWGIVCGRQDLRDFISGLGHTPMMSE